MNKKAEMEISADPKYFDYAASTPIWPVALEAFIEISKNQYANPSSIHIHGKNAKLKLLELKKTFCDMLQLYDGRLLLCGSGSEANNTIIEGHLNLFKSGKLLIAEDVHDSIWYATKKHHKSVKILKINGDGQINIKELERSLEKQISLVCINHVCNETGTIHPIKELAEICYRKKVRILVDGMQAIGHIPVNLNEIPCTYYSISGHKFGAVKASGGVFIRDSEFSALIHGGRQEWNLRAGTEGIAGLASMVAALRESLEIMEAEVKRIEALKSHLISRLKHVPDVLFNSPENSIPGILSVSFPGFAGREIVGALSLAGYAISTGSACHDNEIEPSRIILAMGRNATEASGSVRISMGTGTTKKAVNNLIDSLLEFVMK